MLKVYLLAISLKINKLTLQSQVQETNDLNGGSQPYQACQTHEQGNHHNSVRWIVQSGLWLMTRIPLLLKNINGDK